MMMIYVSGVQKSPNFSLHWRQVSLSGHLFDQHLINEALNVICDGGGRYRLKTLEPGQTDDETSSADLEVRLVIYYSTHFYARMEEVTSFLTQGPKVCGPYVVTILNWKPKSEWYI
jgi:hypothetical protein